MEELIHYWMVCLVSIAQDVSTPFRIKSFAGALYEHNQKPSKRLHSYFFWLERKVFGNVAFTSKV